MQIRMMTPSDKLWNKVGEYAENCSWRAGKSLFVSDHENLYEKYGFAIIDRKTALWGETEKIYMQRL